MNDVNLLPWREEQRQVRDKQMVSSAVLIGILCAAAVFGSFSYLQLLQDNQRGRNNYLTTEIGGLDKKIAEIERLKKQKSNLITRMEVILDLQRQRNQLVKIFDDIVHKLPDGVYFGTMDKEDDGFSFTGTAQSNARVSNLMENLGSSSWFDSPDLNVINIAPSQGIRLSQFDIKISLREKEKTQQSGS